MNKKRKEKFGDLLLDIAKYIITAVLLATWFNGVEAWEWYSYIIPVVAVVLAIVVGLHFYTDDNKTNKKEGE